MSSYKSNSASESARQHNGDVYDNRTYNYHLLKSAYDENDSWIESQDAEGQRRHLSADYPRQDAVGASLSDHTSHARRVDARFPDDERAISVWLKKNHLAISKYKDANNQNLIDRMSSYSVYRTFDRLSAERLQGTTEWLLQHTRFKSWLESQEAAKLCLIGKVGSGKTTAMTAVLQRALESMWAKDVPVLSFFFDYPLHNESDLYSSLTQQLLRHFVCRGKPLPALVQVALQDLYNSQLSKPGFESLRDDVLIPLLGVFPGCIFVIDGIDLCKDRGAGLRLQTFFDQLSASSPTVPFKSICSMRDGPLITNDYIIDMAEASDGDQAHSLDIALYIDTALLAKSRPGELLEDNDLRNQVRQELLDKSDGMFLWVKLQIQYLFGDHGLCKTPRDVHQALGKFPLGLGKVYQQCLLADLDNKYTSRILRWVCATPEPTLVDNIRELLAFDPESKTLDEDSFPAVAVVRRAATTLMVLRQETLHGGTKTRSYYIYPAHSTVRDFVFSNTAQFLLNDVVKGNAPEKTDRAPKHTMESSVLEIGSLCVAYVLAFSSGEVERQRTSTIDTAALGQAHYEHVLQQALSSPIATFVTKLIKTCRATVSDHSRTLALPHRGEKTPVVRERFIDYARRNWYKCVVDIDKSSSDYQDFEKLVFSGVHTNCHPWFSGKRSNTQAAVQALLVWALVNDHMPMLVLAIERGSKDRVLTKTFLDENIPALRNQNPLLYGARHCRPTMVRCLLHLYIGSKGHAAPLAFNQAVHAGWIDVVSQFLQYEENDEFPYRHLIWGTGLGGGLSLAAHEGHASICRLLISYMKQSDREPEAIIHDSGYSPLYVAVKAQNLDVVEALLEGENIEWSDNGGSQATKDLLQQMIDRDEISWAYRDGQSILLQEFRHLGVFEKSPESGRLRSERVRYGEEAWQDVMTKQPRNMHNAERPLVVHEAGPDAPIRR